jgi:CBS-domain-containing membrane protein
MLPYNSIQRKRCDRMMKGKALLSRLLPGIGGFIAIYAGLYVGDLSGLTLLMAPFGATCVLIFALSDSPLAQPRNVIGGHVLSSFIGLLLLELFGLHFWSIALAVGLAIMLMQWTRTVHPPAGADPIVIMVAGASWSFLWTPVLAGALLIVIVGFFYHKAAHIQYPKKWW